MDKLKAVHPCSLCDRKFKTYVFLKRHLRTVHDSNGSDYACDVCNKTFIRSDNMKRHRSSHFNQVKTHQCEDCGKIYMTKSNLLRHRNSHSSPDEHQCKECHMKFSRKDVLRRHHRRIHTQRQKGPIKGKISSILIMLPGHLTLTYLYISLRFLF